MQFSSKPFSSNNLNSFRSQYASNFSETSTWLFSFINLSAWFIWSSESGTASNSNSKSSLFWSSESGTASNSNSKSSAFWFSFSEFLFIVFASSEILFISFSDNEFLYAKLTWLTTSIKSTSLINSSIVWYSYEFLFPIDHSL